MLSSLFFYTRAAWLRLTHRPRPPVAQQEEFDAANVRVLKATYVDSLDGRDVTHWIRTSLKLHSSGIAGWREGAKWDRLLVLTGARLPCCLLIEYRYPAHGKIYRARYFLDGAEHSEGQRSILFPPYGTDVSAAEGAPVAAFVARPSDGAAEEWKDLSAEYKKEAGPACNFYADVPALSDSFGRWIEDLRLSGWSRLKFLYSDGSERDVSL